VADECERRVVLSGATTAGVTILGYQTVGDHELVTVANNSGAPVKVSVGDYSFTNNIFDQKYFSSKTVDLKDGAIKTISVDLACGMNNQFDVLVNEAPLRGAPNYFFDPHFLGAGFAFNVTCPTGEKAHGNEGLGNGVDPLPPGHAGDAQQNDDPGHGPGNPNKGFNKG